MNGEIKIYPDIAFLFANPCLFFLRAIEVPLLSYNKIISGFYSFSVLSDVIVEGVVYIYSGPVFIAHNGNCVDRLFVLSPPLAEGVSEFALISSVNIDESVFPKVVTCSEISGVIGVLQCLRILVHKGERKSRAALYAL